jgi:hypothetical protein
MTMTTARVAVDGMTDRSVEGVSPCLVPSGPGACLSRKTDTDDHLRARSFGFECSGLEEIW